MVVVDMGSRISEWYSNSKLGASAESRRLIDLRAASVKPQSEGSFSGQIPPLLVQSLCDALNMGLRMDDIHIPTVPSGPTTDHTSGNGVTQDKRSLMDLVSEKTRVEEELKALSSVLDSVCVVLRALDALADI